MALFGKKKTGDDAASGGAEATGGNAEGVGGFNPDAARKFFDHARNMHETENFEYAMQLWLNGLGHDPSDMDGFRGFAASAAQFAQSAAGKKGVDKDFMKALNGRGAIAKYQQALLAFGMRPDDAAAALKAAESAAELGVKEQTELLGRGAFKLAQADKKRQKKDVYVKLLDLFEKGSAFELALQAGEVAKQLDPSDTTLQNRLRDMAAKSAMAKGGFDEAGQAGGFRKNIRDLNKQTELASQDTLSKTEDVKERLLAAAEEEYKLRPGDVPTIEKLGRALLDMGRLKDDIRALNLYKKAFEETGQFRFRQAQGDVDLRMKRRTLRALQAKAAAAPGDEAVAQQLRDAERLLLETETAELRLQVEAYPTDLPRKFELGKRLAVKGDHAEAIKLFQVAQEDARSRRSVLGWLAQSFLSIGWQDEAIGTFRQSVENLPDESSELALELYYGLGSALQAKADADGDLEAAQEADKIFSRIAMKRFDYRDIRDRRDATKKIVERLRG